MVSLRLVVRASVVSVLLASLAVVGSGVMASGTASASPSTCYPPGSTSCPGALTVSPSTVVRGETVKVTGKGFSAGANVSINVCNIRKVTTGAFDVGLLLGDINVSFTMPDHTPLGACKFTATGLGTNEQTLTLTTTVTVKSATNTTLKLAPLKVTYGNEQVEVMSVKVSPEFAAPTPTGKVTISEGKTTLCVLTLLSGKGSCGLTNKELKTAGTHHIVATYGGSSKFVGSFARETLTVTLTVVTGTLTVVPSTVVRGGTVTVTGKGFSAGANVSINVCNIKKITTAAFNEALLGHINVSFKMPDNTPLGACKFTATGLGANKQTLTLTTTVTVKSAATKTVLKLSAAKVTYGDEQVEPMSVTVSPEFTAPAPTGKVTISEGKRDNDDYYDW